MSILDEHQPGDVVSGRIVEVGTDSVLTELGEGTRATCRIVERARQERSDARTTWRGKTGFKVPELDARSAVEGWGRCGIVQTKEVRAARSAVFESPSSIQ